MGNDGRKIPFHFSPIPKLFCNQETLANRELLVFICWSFNRCSSEKRNITIGYQQVELEAWEFVFGRESCSIETSISEQTLRTILKFLGARNLLKKVTIKSTTKFTIYRWASEVFSDNSNQQSNPRVTSNQPASNHKQEYKKQEVRKAAASPLIEKLPENSSHLILGDKAKEMLKALPTIEQEEILTLFGQRSKNKPIANPAGWIVQCINHGWHKAKEVVIVSIPDEMKPGHVEVNRKMGQRIVDRLKGIDGIKIYQRGDFLELGREGCRLPQIFYFESTEIFGLKVRSVLKKLHLLDDNMLQCLSDRI